MDFATLIGLVFALTAVIGGFLAEGGHVTAVLQPTAAIIVLGGTLGAIFVQFPLSHLRCAARGAVTVLLTHQVDLAALVMELVGYAQKARREGVVSLEVEAESATDPFLKKALNLAVDGSESRVVRESMEVELEREEEVGERGAKVFEAAGGYAPTVGILGAVLGLIHVMQNLADPSKLGAGIAVAFVATVYGVGFANLLFLPIAGKLALRHRAEMQRYELIIAGVAAIVDGENPRLIEEKLNGYCDSRRDDAGTGSGNARAAA